MTEQTQQPQSQIPQDIDIPLVLKLSHINTIIASLDELPHKISRILIDHLRTQAIAFLQNLEKQQNQKNELHPDFFRPVDGKTNPTE